VNYEDSELVVYSTLSNQRKTVLHNATYGRYVPTGHMVYMHQGTLFAVPFDLKHLEVIGQPVPVLEDVVSVALHGGAQYSISDTGNLVYAAGHNNILDLSLFWMDRQGRFAPLRETPSAYYTPVFSPDGERLAITIYDGKKSEIWVYEWQRDILSRLTSDSVGDQYPIWTPDGLRITYARTERDGSFSVYWRRADGTGDVQRLAKTQVPVSLGSCSWSPDGKLLAFTQINPKPPLDIYTLSVDGDEKTGWKFSEPKLFLKNSFFPAFSPDGRWIAYSSDDSGSWEVYVRPFPGPGAKSQVSTAGGLFPVWSRNRKELLYRSLDGKIMVAKYGVSGGSFNADKPQLWSPGQLIHRGGDPTFDLHPDGKRFAVLKPVGSGEPAPVNKVRFVFNFFDKLRREVPAKK
jgi:dipeptidyl aminopeptidase/acylaminoacyl peptidase